jgi:hypothetical protein
MSSEYSILKAEFKSGGLVVTDPGPEFPPDCKHFSLVSRLNQLAENGWIVKSVTLKGTTLVITLVTSDDSDIYVSQYSILMFQTYLQQSTRAPFSILQRQYNETIQVWKELGWSEVKTVHLYTIDQELWVVTLLVMDWECTDPRSLLDIKGSKE